MNIGVDDIFGNPDRAPQSVKAILQVCRDGVQQILSANVDTWFLVFLALFLVIRFGPVLFSWFRHRGDVKQLGDS